MDFVACIFTLLINGILQIERCDRPLNTRLNKLIALPTLALLTLMTFASAVNADEKAEKIIDNAVKAYGGDSLLQLQQLTLQDTLNQFGQGQSNEAKLGAFMPTLDQHKIEISIDFANSTKEFKRSVEKLVGNHDKSNMIAEHHLFIEAQGYRVDHCQQQYQPLSWINFDNADLGISQWLDPLIIKKLHHEKSASQWVDTVYIQGQAHDVIVVHKGKKQEYTLYLNQGSGLLSRMLQKRGTKTRQYDFLTHQQLRGITWSTQLYVSTDNKPLYHTVSRKLTINKALDKQTAIPKGYTLNSPDNMINVSAPSFRQLADNVYFVGQDWGYTLFVDVGEYFISAGAWGHQDNDPAWQNALTLLRQKTGNDKSVKQHIVTHHHTDHMSGLATIAAQGANFIIHPDNIDAVQKHLTTPLPSHRFVPIATTTMLANDQVMLFDLPNSHANHNLMVYLPEHKILFTEDIFGSSFETALDPINSWPNLDAFERQKRVRHETQSTKIAR